MERYEHPDMTATLDGQELPDLDEMTLQWVFAELDDYQEDEREMEQAAWGGGLAETARWHLTRYGALNDIYRRLAERARDRKDAR